jgi:dienelactone hydrolase
MAKSVWREIELFDDDCPDPTSELASRYNELAAEHEHTVEKYCTVFGTTFSGLISYEDRVAAAYLAGRPDVRAGGLGCVGLSGGGLRATLLQATCGQIRAAAVVGMMSTYEGLLDHNMSHTWGLFPRGWSRRGDWPDVAACRAPSPLMVQYNLEDQIFTQEGMRAAHRRLRAHYRAAGRPGNYTGRFYPGPHKFDLQMQKHAFDWLANTMK